MENGKIEDRLASLQSEFEAGQARLRQLEGEQSYLRETLLRISGAIQVLRELVGEGQPTQSGSAAAAMAGNDRNSHATPR